MNIETWEEIGKNTAYPNTTAIELSGALTSGYDQFKIEISNIYTDAAEQKLYAVFGSDGVYQDGAGSYGYIIENRSYAAPDFDQGAAELSSHIDLTNCHLMATAPGNAVLTLIITPGTTGSGVSMETGGMIWDDANHPNAISGQGICYNLPNLDSLKLFTSGNENFTATASLYGRVVSADKGKI